MTTCDFSETCPEQCHDIYHDSYHDLYFNATNLKKAPVGTKAPAIMGGAWYKTDYGWKWGALDGDGGVFPRPGGDWTGVLIYPKG